MLSCSEDIIENPLDSELKKNIIGTWRDIYDYSITFFTDGIFVDSMYFEGITDTSYRSYGLLIRRGKYSITNSVLSKSEFYFDKVVTDASIGFAMYAQLEEISINNGILRSKPFSSFNNIGNKRNDIWDKWETKSWYCQFDAVDSTINGYGSCVFQYEFYADSSKYLYTTIYLNALNDSLQESAYNIDFEYNPPILNSSLYTNTLVQFKNKKMYWYYTYTIPDLIRMN